MFKNKSKIISIKTTAKCQLRCANCFVVPWMNKNRGFEMSIGDVDNFIRSSVDSSYHFSIILLSGGEPLLWSNLKYAASQIKKHRITDRIKILTNAIAVTEDNIESFPSLVKDIDVVRISKYIGNEKNIGLIQKRFPKMKNIHVSDKTEFFIQASNPVADSLPANCACDYPTVFGNEIDACGGARFLNLFHGIEGNEITVKIKKDFLKKLESPEIKNAKIMTKACQYCMVNRKVLGFLKKENNTVIRRKHD